MTINELIEAAEHMLGEIDVREDDQLDMIRKNLASIAYSQLAVARMTRSKLDDDREWDKRLDNSLRSIRRKVK
jgi:hypothetical protein